MQVNVEHGLTKSGSSFRAAAEQMTRMNGGTSIAQPLATARDLFLSSSTPSSSGGASPYRTVVLITDARLDIEQSNEAFAYSQSLQSELAQLMIFGIGRGADKMEIMRLLNGSEEPSPLSRYLPLRTPHPAMPHNEQGS